MKKIITCCLALILLLTGVASIPEVNVQAAGKTMYVTASTLNVRQSASIHSKVIATVKKNTALTVLQTKGTWSKVTVNKKNGWVSNKYLSSKKPASTSPKKTSTTMYVTASALNVRQSASIKAKVILVIKKDTSVKVTGKKGDWSKVEVKKKNGWVSSKYLTSKKPVASKPVPKNNNLAANLKTVDGNNQLILVTSNGFNTSSADIRTFEKNAKGEWVPLLTMKGFIGKYGFTNNMREGGASSPVGKYSIGTAFGQIVNPGTKLPYRKITSDDVWVDDPKSKLYNTWQSRSKTKGQWKSAENMTHPLYKYGFVINYNTQRTPYKGSAIFFHIANSYTLGCTATSEANVIKILKWLDPAKKPVIIQTPISDLHKY